MKGVSTWLKSKDQEILVSLMVLFFIGMIYSVFLFGLSYFILISLSLYYYLQKTSENKKLRNEEVFSDLYNWIPVVFFLLYLVSFFWSEDMMFWWSRVRIKLPFLVFPLFLLGWSRPLKKTMQKVLLGLVTILFISVIPVDVMILKDLPGHYELLSRGQMSYTPTNHVRYSMLLAWGALVGLDLGIGEFRLKKNSIFPLLISVVLFLSLHLLAIRTGLITVYVLGVVYLMTYIARQNKTLAIASLVILGLTAGVLSQIPTIKEKIGYQISSLEQYQETGKWQDSSDGMRFMSIDAGLRLGSQNFWTGVGAGDMKNEMHTLMKAEYRYNKPVLPHNQFVTVFLGCGIFALLFYVLIFGGILSSSGIGKSPVFLLHSIMIVISCLVENTLETALGVAVFIVPYYLGKHYVNKK